ncbi:MAG: AAA family ATPase [candidate division KSB1 bacterium]|nr:AAA family ATPase [candidate division KSB1 bacterium]
MAYQTPMTTIEPILLAYLLEKGVGIRPVDRDTIVLGPVPVDPGVFTKPQSNLLLRRVEPWDRYIVCVDADLETRGRATPMSGVRFSHPANGWKAILFEELAGDPSEALLETLQLLGAPDLPPPHSLRTQKPPGRDFRPPTGRLSDHFTKALTELPRDGELPPTIGRDKEVHQVLAVIQQWHRMVPLVVGESGAGKSNLLVALSRKLMLSNRRVRVLEVVRLTAEYNLPGEAERAFDRILDEMEAESNCVLAIDDVDVLLSCCSQREILLRRLADCGVPAFATALPGFLRNLESPILRRRYFPVVLYELNGGQTREVLRALKPLVERHHRVRIPEPMIDLCVGLSSGRPGVFPGKAVDLLDLACAEVAERKGDTLTADDLVATAGREGFASPGSPLDPWSSGS